MDHVTINEVVLFSKNLYTLDGATLKEGVISVIVDCFQLLT